MTERSGAAAERLMVVGELASLINTTYNLREIFQSAILKLSRVLPFRRASVLLVSEDRRRYYLHTLYDGERGGFIEQQAEFPLDHGLPGQVIQSGRAVCVDQLEATDDLRAVGEQSVSVIIVPLRVEGVVIGTLDLGRPAPGHYSADDLDFAELLGQQIESSLRHSKLFATVEHQRERLAEEKARAVLERTRLAALIDASDAAVLMVSGGTVEHANGAMARLLGLPREVLAGAAVEQVYRILAGALASPAMLEPQRAALERGAATLRDRVEFLFPTRITCQRTVAPVLGSDGEALGHLVLFRDVTREAEAEAAKSEFVSIVSHELRTPLTSVKTSLALIKQGVAGAVADQMAGLLDIALRNLDRLIRLVDDLLDLSRIESGRLVARMMPVSLAETADRAINAVRAFADGRGVRLELAESPPTIYVVADPDRLEQVFINLLSNAIKFSPTDAPVGLRWWREDDAALVEVSDQGPGIPAAELERIFERFHQLEPAATRAHGGAGLGLTISRTIVRHLGGELWAASTEGQGSRFYVRLKLVTRGETAARTEAGPPAGRRLLLVEREADRHQLWRMAFEAGGWQVEQAAQGADALSLLAGEPVHLVVVATELADMHGLEFVQQVRQVPEHADLPLLLVGPAGDATTADDAGADGWVLGDPDALLAEAARIAALPRRTVTLLIEDDPALRSAVTRALRRTRYACIAAARGDEGVALAGRRRPDIILMDWHTPGPGGEEILRTLRGDARLASVPVVVITGHVTPDVARTIGSFGAELVTKPFELSQLLSVLHKVHTR
ncbi:MAG: response regulator [Gemmatimonadetes bacterium]|nr:response regulator [Gemmatimonadota bacterium]